MVDRHTNETHFAGKLLIDQQASTHRRVIHPALHRDPDVLCSNGCCKERIKVAARVLESGIAVHIAPRGSISAILDFECRNVLVVIAASPVPNTKDRSDAPGVDLHPLPSLFFFDV